MPKFVEVTWLDANSGTGWLKKADIPKPSPCTSRGWLIHEDLDGLTLAATIGHPDPGVQDAEYNQTISIPMGMVTELKELVDGN